MVRTCELFVVEAVSGIVTNDKKLATIYEAEKSYDFVVKHGVDIYRLSSSQGDGFHFFFCEHARAAIYDKRSRVGGWVGGQWSVNNNNDML